MRTFDHKMVRTRIQKVLLFGLEHFYVMQWKQVSTINDEKNTVAKHQYQYTFGIFFLVSFMFKYSFFHTMLNTSPLNMFKVLQNTLSFA